MIKIVLIGSGNVAQHLITAFSKSKEIDIVQVFTRKKDSLKNLINDTKITTDSAEIVVADLYIIAVSDDAIKEVSSLLPFKNRLVVHTSGSVSMAVLDPKNRSGIFYPLQTFTKKATIDFRKVPMCIESKNETDIDLLEKVAKSISDNVVKIDEKQRKALHVSAVFVNNFTNLMYQIGNQICIENKVPFEILKPLILETANKVQLLSPKEAQTGPAKRNDTQTIDSHLDFLTNKNHAEIYKILTQSILNNGKEL